MALVKDVLTIVLSRTNYVLISLQVNGLFPVGTRCKLRCRSGYVPSPPMKKRCHNDGSWIGPDGACIKKSAAVTTTTTTPPPPRPPLVSTCKALKLTPNLSVYPPSCTQSATIPPGARCSFQCPEGFKMEGERSLRCRETGQWDVWPPPRCAPVEVHPKPFIICPPDVMKPLMGKASSAYVMFPQPKTNVDWFR